jgi:hypothetical protein
MTMQLGTEQFMPTATIVADSISPDGTRLTTALVTFHRFILAEVNTHRKLSRNSASSRARSFESVLNDVANNPAFALSWPREQPGMSGGAELDGDDLADAQAVLRGIAEYTITQYREYLDRHPDKSTRLHKSILNRPLEWFASHTAIITSTEWDNLFHQRCDANAQPEFRVLAELMRDALAANAPTPVEWFDWHLPLVGLNPDDVTLDEVGQVKVCAARCARTSYLTHDGRRDLAEDFRLFDSTLFSKGHWSPLEHPAVAVPPGFYNHRGNFDRPWLQARHLFGQRSAGDTVERAVADLVAARETFADETITTPSVPAHLTALEAMKARFGSTGDLVEESLIDIGHRLGIDPGTPVDVIARAMRLVATFGIDELERLASEHSLPDHVEPS